MKQSAKLLMSCVVAFSTIGQCVATSSDDAKGWHSLRERIREAEQRDTALLDQAGTNGLPVAGRLLVENWASVHDYLKQLSADELIAHAREWIRNMESDKEDPEVITHICLDALRTRSPHIGVTDKIISIFSDDSEPQEFREALFYWWGSRTVSTDDDGVSREAHSTMDRTTSVLLEVINEAKNSDKMRAQAYSFSQRFVAIQRQVLVKEFRNIGLLPSDEGDRRASILALAQDGNIKMDRVQREKVLALYQQQRESLRGAEILLKKKNLSKEALYILKPALRAARMSSMNDSIRADINTLEGKVAEELDPDLSVPGHGETGEGPKNKP